MLRRKRAQSEAAPPAPTDTAMESTSRMGPNGYVVTELPTYWAGKRRIVVYTSAPDGRIIKTFKK